MTLTFFNLSFVPMPDNIHSRGEGEDQVMIMHARIKFDNSVIGVSFGPARKCRTHTERETLTGKKPSKADIEKARLSTDTGDWHSFEVTLHNQHGQDMHCWDNCTREDIDALLRMFGRMQSQHQYESI